MAQARSERDLALSYIERRFGVAESLIVQACDVFVRRIAHRGVVAIDVECSHLGSTQIVLCRRWNLWIVLLLRRRASLQARVRRRRVGHRLPASRFLML